jgi:hypothetical protein
VSAPEVGSVWAIKRGRNKGREVRIERVTADVVYFKALWRKEFADTYMDRAWFLTFYEPRAVVEAARERA